MTDLNKQQPSDEFVRGIEITTLLPQQPPFVMVGRLEHFDMKCVRTSLEVAQENIFVENGAFSAAGLIENVAQTCAARIGYVNKYIHEKGIDIGFIGSIRNFEVHALPNVGDRIETEVEVQEEIFGMVLATANVKCNGKILASTEIKIAIKEGV